jgi:EAL domain-containing protein (putative c-di-GMP-specific phosphodiesterase class I)
VTEDTVLTTPPSAQDHAPAGLLAVQQARLRKVLATILAVLLGMSLMYAIVGTYATAISLLVASVLLLPSFVFNRHHRVHLAADWMLCALTVAIGILAINGQGLRDTALLAYPGLLVFAIMLWRNRTMLALLLGQVVIVCIIWWLDTSGLYPSKVAAAAATQIIDIAAVVGLTAFASWLIASDQRNYLHATVKENERVSDALAKLEHAIRHDGLTGLPNRKLADMRRGLKAGQFELHYQPKFDLHTHALCGAEALLRWKHPNRGNVPPATFIPLAEKSGLIAELGNLVIHSACQQMQQWRQAGLVVPPVAVNVSMVQFRKGDLKDVVYSALQATNLPGHLLELELTESLLSDSHAAVQTTLEHIRRMGVSLAIDDFGTGYSNLGYLKQFEIQTLKIDQSFVRKLGTVQHDQAIVKAIVNIATQLGLSTVAEGVESTEVADTLRQLGCHTGQGYLWSPALPADAFAQRFLPGATP